MIIRTVPAPEVVIGFNLDRQMLQLGKVDRGIAGAETACSILGTGKPYDVETDGIWEQGDYVGYVERLGGILLIVVGAFFAATVRGMATAINF